MQIDQPGAIPMWVNPENMFASTDATWVVLHKTAGFSTAQQCGQYFQSQGLGGVSAHYIVGMDGTIVQCVPESQGAGANCCCTNGHAAYLPTDVNLNIKTISVEHIDPSTDNSTPVTPEQYAASKQLVHDICVRHNIPMRGGDASGGIIGHCDIDPINRSRCPGNYPTQQLIQDLGEMIVNPNRIKAAQDTWNMTAFMFGNIPLPYTTGIAQAWQRKYQQDGNMPPPTTREADSVDWNSNHIVVQYFGSIRCEWVNGNTANWYNANGGGTIN